MSLTGRSSTRNARMSRRRASATALKTSDVVAARGTDRIYIPVTEYVKSPRQRHRIGPLRVSRLQMSIVKLVVAAVITTELVMSLQAQQAPAGGRGAVTDGKLIGGT